MKTTEVSVYERVAGLGLIRRTFRQTGVPLAVFLPRVGFEESVLGRGVRLYLAQSLSRTYRRLSIRRRAFSTPRSLTT
jgi:hypothetical protein